MVVNPSRFGRFLDWVAIPHRLESAAYLRIVIGSTTALFYLEHYDKIALLWGPKGQIPAVFLAPTHLNVATRLWMTSAGTTALVWIGIISSLALALGVLPRLAAAVVSFMMITTFQRNDMILDGGQNILTVMAFYLCFADTSKAALLPGDILERFRLTRRLKTILHNGAMFVILAQISMVYFWASYYKLTGHKWEDGTALYYIMRADVFALPGVSHFFFLSATFVTVATYMTMVVEFGFSVFLWNRIFRLPFLGAIILMHMGIAVLMGLAVFGVTMILIDCTVLTTADCRRVIYLFAWAKAKVLRQSRGTALPGRIGA